MKIFHIYSDESRHKNERFLLLSGLWVNAENTAIAEQEVQALRQRHGFINSEGVRIDFLGEFKWTKVSKRYLHVYKDLTDLFFGWIKRDLVRFNTMLVDTHNPTVAKYSNIKNEGYFKFLYQLYFHNSKIPGIYKIFPDKITNPIQANVNFNVLLRCLNAGFKRKFASLVNPSDIPESGEFVEGIIPVDSKRSQFIQVVDVIMGALGFLQNKLDERPNAGQAKIDLMKHVIDKLILSRTIQVSGKKYYVARSTKFNIWLFRPKEKAS